MELGLGEKNKALENLEMASEEREAVGKNRTEAGYDIIHRND